jgi:hypothetical protein
VSDAGLARTENLLEQALLAARRRGDVTALLPVLADADVFLPTPAVDGDGQEVPLALVDVGGRPFVPVFSSLTALARYRPEGGAYLQLSGRALAEAVPGELAVVLDPGSELAVPVEPADLARLRDAPPPDGEAELVIGEPREEPAEALDALRRFAAARPEVRAAYRALLVLRAGGGAEPVIGLELEPGADGEAVLGAAAEAARAAGVESLALVVVADDEIGTFLRDKTEPFYRRAC